MTDGLYWVTGGRRQRYVAASLCQGANLLRGGYFHEDDMQSLDAPELMTSGVSVSGGFWGPVLSGRHLVRREEEYRPNFPWPRDGYKDRMQMWGLRLPTQGEWSAVFGSWPMPRGEDLRMVLRELGFGYRI